MNLNRWLTILLMSIFSTVALFADQTEDLRKKLAQTKGPERITILQNLYDLSLEFDDLDYQLRCINQLIDECQKQDATHEEADARVLKIILFYNNDLNVIEAHFGFTPWDRKHLGVKGENKDPLQLWLSQNVDEQ